MSLLILDHVDAAYGPVQALHQASLHVEPGEIVTLIGANGAGKSTLLMTICARPQAKSGQVWFEQQDITHLPTHRIARLGIRACARGPPHFPPR